MTKEELIEILEAKKRVADQTIRDLAAALLKDADQALQWSQSEFVSAARAKVFGYVIHALNEKATVETVREHAMEQVLIYAGSPARSTSTTANLMTEARAQAWHDVVDTIKWRA